MDPLDPWVHPEARVPRVGLQGTDLSWKNLKERVNEQWFFFFLGFFFVLPFLVGICLPCYTKQEPKFPTRSYRTGRYCNVAFFSFYLVSLTIIALDTALNRTEGA